MAVIMPELTPEREEYAISVLQQQKDYFVSQFLNYKDHIYIYKYLHIFSIMKTNNKSRNRKNGKIAPEENPVSITGKSDLKIEGRNVRTGKKLHIFMSSADWKQLAEMASTVDVVTRGLK